LLTVSRSFMNVVNSVLWRMAIILKANKVNLFVLSVFWYHSPKRFRHTTYMELLVKPEILTSYIYMDLRLATLKSVSIYLPHNVSTLNQCRKLSCGTVVCKHFASYQGYPTYRWD
jgi:hypothetical protein